MSELMTPISFRQLMTWIVAEHDREGSVFGVHRPFPQSWFQVMRDNRNVLRLRDGSYEGAELWPFGWVIHTHRSKSGWLPRVGLFRTVAWAYLIRAYALESAILYTQVHGLPFRLGKYPPGSSAEDKAALRTALANLGRDASGIIPQGMEILFESPANATQDIPGILVTRCEQGMSKAILGGTLPTQADGKTSTNALGEVHNEVRHDILTSDAAQIAATITRQILAPLAYLNCGVSDPALLPWFRFDTRQAEDIQVFADALPKLASVMDIPAAWAHEKLKIPQAEEGEKVLAVKPQAMPEPAALTASAKAEDGPASSGYADQDAIDAMQADDALADAAEALLGHRLHGITAHAAPGRRRVNRDRHVVDGQLLGRRGVERRKHLVQGRQRRGLLGRRDRLHGNHIDEAHSGRSHEGDAEEDGRHVQKCTFHAVTSSYFTPKRLGLTYLLIRGTQAFIIRIANDMPSG